MSRFHVIPPEEALRLNAMAQEIDPRLFWTCNYEPTVSYSINEDALFLEGIQDLYKFAIDSNCVFKAIALNYTNSICRNLLSSTESDTMRSHLNTIQMLRAVIDHNHSIHDGRQSAEQLMAYSTWIQTELGKAAPENTSDFSVLCNSLASLGNSVVSDSELIIDRLRRKKSQDDIARNWKKAIIQWYCTGARRHYYLSQVDDYYITRAVRHKPSFLERLTDSQLRGKISDWIRVQITHELDEHQKERQDIISHINHPSARELELEKDSPDKFEELQKWRRQRLSEIDAACRAIEQEHDRLRSVYQDRKLDWFFDKERLQGQLLDTVRRLNEAKVDYTLLPDSILQYDVRHNFEGVPSPDGDF